MRWHCKISVAAIDVYTFLLSGAAAAIATRRRLELDDAEPHLIRTGRLVREFLVSYAKIGGRLLSPPYRGPVVMPSTNQHLDMPQKPLYYFHCIRPRTS